MRRSTWPGVAAVALVAVIFAPVFHCDWVWDDTLLIVENDRIQGIDGILAGVTGGLWTDTPTFRQPAIYYRPVMRWSLVLDDALGLSPALAHLHSLLVHLAAVAGIFALGRRLSGQPQVAGLAAALYGLHPIQVEAVAWVSARNDLQAAAAALWAAWFMMGASSKRVWPTVLGASMVAAASKESAYLLPAALLLLAWGWDRVSDVEVRRALGASAVGVGSVVAGRLLAGIAWPPGADSSHLLASAPFTTAFALEALIWPVSRVPGAHLAWPEPVAWTALLAGALGLLLLAGLGRRRALGALGFGAVTALPAWVAVAHVGLFGDRYFVLPLAGVVLALASTVRGSSSKVGLLVGVLAAAGLTSQNLLTWRDNTTLWSTAAQAHDNPHTAGSYAKTLELAGDFNAAANWYARATVAPHPLEHACWNVAAIHFKRNRPTDAAAAGLRALDNGCPHSGELTCPTAYGMALTGRFNDAARLGALADSDPWGLCRVVDLADAARSERWDALEGALESSSLDERSALANKVGGLLKDGGDPETDSKVRKWAQSPAADSPL